MRSAALHCASEWQQHAPIIWAILSLHHITLAAHHTAAGWNASPLLPPSGVAAARGERAAGRANENRFSLASDSRENHRLQNMIICVCVCMG